MADQPNSVFDGNEPAAPVTPANPTPSGNLEDLLKNIKNENGEQKYKSLEDALVALDHSQKFIPELKNQLTGTQAQLEEMRGQVSKFSAVEETVQRLLAQQQTPPVVTPPEASGLDEQAVIKLVQASLSQSKQVETQAANQQKVNDMLVGKFGEKAVEVLDTKAAELKTTRQALGELAKQNPDLVLALFSSPATKDPLPSVPGRRTPDPVTPHNELPKPGKSMLSGATYKEQASRWNDITKSVYQKHGIDS